MSVQAVKWEHFIIGCLLQLLLRIQASSSVRSINYSSKIWVSIGMHWYKYWLSIVNCSTSKEEPKTCWICEQYICLVRISIIKFNTLKQKPKVCSRKLHYYRQLKIICLYCRVYTCTSFDVTRKIDVRHLEPLTNRNMIWLNNYNYQWLTYGVAIKKISAIDY